MVEELIFRLCEVTEAAVVSIIDESGVECTIGGGGGGGGGSSNSSRKLLIVNNNSLAKES